MKLVGFLLSVCILLTGCSAKSVRETGEGIRLGSVGGRIYEMPLLALGVLLEKIGGASEGGEPKRTVIDAKTEYLSSLAEQGLSSLFVRRLHTTPETTPEQISDVARSVCSEVDKIVAEKGGLEIHRNEVVLVRDEFLPKGDVFTVELEYNPYGKVCVEELEAAGQRLVKIAKKGGLNRIGDVIVN